jgi:hypothetical protein
MWRCAVLTIVLASGCAGPTVPRTGDYPAAWTVSIGAPVKPATGRLDVTIVDPDGIPIELVNVVLLPTAQQALVTRVTGESGRAIIDQVSPGRHEVVLIYAERESRGFVTIAAGETVEIRAIIDPGHESMTQDISGASRAPRRRDPTPSLMSVIEHA